MTRLRKTTPFKGHSFSISLIKYLLSCCRHKLLGTIDISGRFSRRMSQLSKRSPGLPKISSVPTFLAENRYGLAGGRR